MIAKCSIKLNGAMSMEEAAVLVNDMVGAFPRYEPHNKTKHLAKLGEVLRAYSVALARTVVGELPKSLKYIPTAAELKDALEGERRRYDLIRANAISHKQERDRRVKEAAEEAKYSAGTPERRAEVVRNALRSM